VPDVYRGKEPKFHRFYRWRKSPSIHWTGGWVEPRASLDVIINRKISAIRKKSLVIHTVTLLAELSQFILITWI
jgi:hypothetical protein